MESEKYASDFSIIYSGNVPILSEMAMLDPYFKRDDLYVFRYSGEHADEVVEHGDLLDGVYQFISRPTASVGSCSIRGFSHHAVLDQLAASHASDGHADQADCLAAFVLQSVAEQLDVDVLLTERSCLKLHGRRTSRDVSMCTTREFIGLLGLLLRARGDWSFVGPRAFPLGSWRGALVASRALITKDHLLVAAATADDARRQARGKSRDLAGAAFSIFRRLARSLAIRDEIHKQYFLPVTNQTGDAASSQLEWLALNLSGTFDLLSKFVALLVNFPLSKKSDLLSGEMRSFVLRVAGSHFRPIYNSEIESTIRLCRVVRNSIHDATLDDVASQGRGREWLPLIELPVYASGEVCKYLAELGEGDVDWGIRSSYRENRVMIEADVFADKLLDSVVRALNRMIDLIPFENLKGYDPTFRVEKEREGEFSSTMQRRAILLYGLT